MADCLSACRTPARHRRSISKRRLATLARTPWFLGHGQKGSAIWNRLRACQSDRPFRYDCAVEIRPSRSIRDLFGPQHDSSDYLCECVAVRQRSAATNGSPLEQTRKPESLHKPMGTLGGNGNGSLCFPCISSGSKSDRGGLRFCLRSQRGPCLPYGLGVPLHSPELDL